MNGDEGIQEMDLQIDTPEGTSGTVTAPPGMIVVTTEEGNPALKLTEMVLPGGKHAVTLRSN